MEDQIPRTKYDANQFPHFPQSHICKNAIGQGLRAQEFNFVVVIFLITPPLTAEEDEGNLLGWK